MPKGFRTNGRKDKKVSSHLDLVTPDIFGDRSPTDLAFDWGEVKSENVLTIIQRVCHAGGYVSFSAGVGGESIKFSLSIGGSQGYRWAHRGQELNGFLARALDVIQQHERRLRDSEGVAGQPSEPALDKSTPKG